MFLGKIEKDTVGFATFLLKLFKTGFGLSVSGYPKCILNSSCKKIKVSDVSAKVSLESKIRKRHPCVLCVRSVW